MIAPDRLSITPHSDDLENDAPALSPYKAVNISQIRGSVGRLRRGDSTRLADSYIYPSIAKTLIFASK